MRKARHRRSRLLLLCVVIGALLAAALPSNASFQMKGVRRLGLAVGEGDGETFTQALDAADAAGVDTPAFSVNWNEIETAPFTYVDPGRCDPAQGQTCPNGQYVAGVFEKARNNYIPRGMKLNFSLRAIMAGCKVTPEDLMDNQWNDQEMIDRFYWVLYAANLMMTDGTGTLGVASMSLGTELEGHLEEGSDLTYQASDSAIDYTRFKTFFDASRTNARSMSGWSNVPVGVTTAWGDMVNDPPGSVTESDAIAYLDTNADRIMFTYYGIGAGFQVKDPWNDTINDINALIAHPNFDGRLYDIYEAGYPTSPVLGGTDAKQELFVQAMFGISDEYATPNPNNPIIHSTIFQWQVDISPMGTEYIVNSPWFGGGCGGGGLPGTPAKPSAPTITPVGGTGSTTWKYTVMAKNAAGDSLQSQPGTVTNGVAALSGSTYNRINYSAVSGATSYTISRTYVGGGSSVPSPKAIGVLGTTSSLEFWDTGLQPTTGIPPRPSLPQLTPLGTAGNNLWIYSVVAVNASGDSVQSQQVETLIGNATLTSTNKNRLTWPAVTGATSYKIFRTGYIPGASPSTVGQIGTTTGTSFDDTGLAPLAGVPGKPVTPTIASLGTQGSTIYKYYVIATNASGAGMQSLEAETTLGNATLNATNKNRISWTAVGGATGYKIYRSHVGAGSAHPTLGQIGTTTSATTFDDTGIAATVTPPRPGAPNVVPQGGTGTTTWRYEVIARRVWGVEGNGEYYDSMPTPIGQTTTGRATLTSTFNNRVSWAAVPGATKYLVRRVYVGPGGSPATTGYIGQTTSTQFDDTGIAPTAYTNATYLFYEYIRTLGMRTNSPVVDKLAFDRLQTEGNVRGWT